MNGTEEKSPESHEHKRQLRLQKQREQSRARLPLWNKLKSNANEGSNCTLKHENVVSTVAGLKKEARKHRSDSTQNDSEMPADFSVKQPSKRLAGCWIKAKVMLAAMKMIKTTTTTLPETRALILRHRRLRLWQRRCEQGRGQGLDVRPLSQTLTSGHNMRTFPLLMEDRY